MLCALAAKQTIDLRGNGILTDSFDSRSLWMSNFGQYDATVYAGDNGDVVSNDGISTIAETPISTAVSTSARARTVIFGTHGAVGTHAWQGAGNKGFQAGHVLQDATNFTFPAISLPYSSGLNLGGPQTIVTRHL